MRLDLTGFEENSKKWSGRADLNGRPPAPKAGALTRLRYAPFSELQSTNFKLHIITNNQIENGIHPASI